MHVVLGGRGAVGRHVCKVLDASGIAYRAPSSLEADVRDGTALSSACEGAEAIICCVGLLYSGSVWMEQWPSVARALVEASRRTGARVVVLDNVYVYGPAPLHCPITEGHPQYPPSRKGQARKLTADILLEAHGAGEAKVTIARAADFYGPGAMDSVLWASFLERMIAGKRPRLLMSSSTRHTYAFTPDIARALVQLSLDEGAMGRVWHLPVGPAETTQDWVDRYNARLGTRLTASFMPPALSSLLGLFVPLVREVHEMRYQFDSDYVLSADAFHVRYRDFQITSYDDGVDQTIEWARGQMKAN